jgi:hypothetical protein
MNRHLNYFYPYSADASHENQVTRSFLALLRLVPLARVIFFDMICEKQSEVEGVRHRLPHFFDAVSLHFDTQTQSLPDDWSALIAVLMTTGDVALSEPIHPRGNKAVYDGLVQVNDFVITIENKPKWTGGEDQLHPDVTPDEAEKLEPTGIVIVWDRLLAQLFLLIQNRLLDETQRLLLEDFMDLVQEHFPQLSPFTNFAVCKRRPHPTYRRCKTILEGLGSGSVWDAGSPYEGGGPYKALVSRCVTRLYLGKETANGEVNCIETRLYPGDTKKQADAFFSKVTVDDFLKLQNKGWTIEPHFHLSFMNTHLKWADSLLGAREYLEYWSSDHSRYAQIKRNDDLDESRFRAWIQDGVFAESDLPELVSCFGSTTRQTLNVCPGFKLAFRWQIDKAEDLDKRCKFTKALKDVVSEALATWGDTLTILETS